MFVAYWTADHEALVSIFSDPDKFYGASPYTFLFAAVLILIFGPGTFSLDALIAKKSVRTCICHDGERMPSHTEEEMRLR